MSSQEVLIMKGQIAANKERLQELEHRCVNACQSVRNCLAQYSSVADIEIARIRAAVADLDVIVQEARSLENINAQLQSRLG